MTRKPWLCFPDQGDKEQAADYWHKEAELGDTGSMVCLGASMTQEQNTSVARHWLTMAQDHGDDRAAEFLAQIRDDQH